MPAESSAATASPRCACKVVCGDVAESDDHPNAHCKGLPRGYSVPDDNEGIEVPWLPR